MLDKSNKLKSLTNYGPNVKKLEHIIRNKFHIDDNKSIIVDWDATRLSNAEIEPVTNTQYEDDLNEKKRQIFVLDKIFLKDIVAQYKKLVK